VVVAVRNGAQTIAQCIDSVIRQENCNVQLIVVDNLSTDNTKQIVTSYGDLVDTYLRESDTGIYDAWNKALSRACGDWCAFLGADDYYVDSTSIRRLISAAEDSVSKVVFAYGGLLMLGAGREYVVNPEVGNPRKQVLGPMLPHPGSIHCTESLKKLGGFNEKFQISGDRDALVRLLAFGTVARSPSVTTAVRLGGISNARSTRYAGARERFQIRSREVSFAYACRHYLLSQLNYYFSHTIEFVLQKCLGKRRGTFIAIKLRGFLGRSPRLQ
jgi:glycosyltransferase involved in cell wall biosynthesis